MYQPFLKDKQAKKVFPKFKLAIVLNFWYLLSLLHYRMTDCMAESKLFLFGNTKEQKFLSQKKKKRIQIYDFFLFICLFDDF